MPDEPEAIGLLALMRLHIARARPFRSDGSLVLLRTRTARWERRPSTRARLVARARRMGRAGPYQLQAAIGGIQATPLGGDGLGAIVALYDQLLALSRRRWSPSTGALPWLSATVPGRRWPRSSRLPHAWRGITSFTLPAVSSCAASGESRSRAAQTAARWP